MMSIVIVLVAPQLPENIGAIARVMGNFSLAKLRVVTPKVSLEDPKAVAMAVASADILKNAQIYSSLQDAVSDCSVAIGTTANPRQMIKHYQTPKSFVQELSQMPMPIALVFGPERTGLNNDELAFCHSTIQIPVNPERSSLNLSHAAAIILHEIYQTQTDANSFWHTGDTLVASSSEVDAFLDYLEKSLDNTHFWRTPAKKTGMKRNLISMFKRHTWFEQDLKTLRGMVNALMKNDPS